jgi:hypothetical protein
VKNITNHRGRAQTLSRVARESFPLTQRFGYSVAEFASLFGRSPTWAYRLIYKGRLKPISDCGRLLIPQSEVDSFLFSRFTSEMIGLTKTLSAWWRDVVLASL